MISSGKPSTLPLSVYGVSRCEMCRIEYKKSEITKFVTKKSLFELKSHLSKRGVFNFDYLDTFKESNGSCKICDTCYLIIVAEQELIEIEKLFALA